MAPPPHVQVLCIILAGVHELLSCSKMKILISNCYLYTLQVLFLFVLSIGFPTVEECPSNWTEWSGEFNQDGFGIRKCYRWFDYGLTWDEADNYCYYAGVLHHGDGHLATIHSPSDNTFVANLAPPTLLIARVRTYLEII